MLPREIDPTAEIEAALSDLHRIVRQSAGDAVALNNLAIAYSHRAEWTQHTGGNPSNDLQLAIDAAKALAAAPTYANAVHALGNLYYERAVWTRKGGGRPEEDLQRAFEIYSKVIELYPNFSPGYNSRGNVSYTRTRILKERGEDCTAQAEAAVRDFSRAIELSPNDFVAYYNRANLYAHIGRYREAIPDWERALEPTPSLKNVLRERIEEARRVLTRHRHVCSQTPMPMSR